MTVIGLACLHLGVLLLTQFVNANNTLNISVAEDVTPITDMLFEKENRPNVERPKDKIGMSPEVRRSKLKVQLKEQVKVFGRDFTLESRVPISRVGLQSTSSTKNFKRVFSSKRKGNVNKVVSIFQWGPHPRHASVVKEKHSRRIGFRNVRWQRMVIPRLEYVQPGYSEKVKRSGFSSFWSLSYVIKKRAHPTAISEIFMQKQPFGLYAKGAVRKEFSNPHGKTSSLSQNKSEGRLKSGIPDQKFKPRVQSKQTKRIVVLLQIMLPSYMRNRTEIRFWNPQASQTRFLTKGKDKLQSCLVHVYEDKNGRITFRKSLACKIMKVSDDTQKEQKGYRRYHDVLTLRSMSASTIPKAPNTTNQRQATHSSRKARQFKLRAFTMRFIAHYQRLRKHQFYPSRTTSLKIPFKIHVPRSWNTRPWRYQSPPQGDKYLRIAQAVKNNKNVKPELHNLLLRLAFNPAKNKDPSLLKKKKRISLLKNRLQFGKALQRLIKNFQKIILGQVQYTTRTGTMTGQNTTKGKPPQPAVANTETPTVDVAQSWRNDIQNKAQGKESDTIQGELSLASREDDRSTFSKPVGFEREKQNMFRHDPVKATSHHDKAANVQTSVTNPPSSNLATKRTECLSRHRLFRLWDFVRQKLSKPLRQACRYVNKVFGHMIGWQPSCEFKKKVEPVISYSKNKGSDVVSLPNSKSVSKAQKASVAKHVSSKRADIKKDNLSVLIFHSYTHKRQNLGPPFSRFNINAKNPDASHGTANTGLAKYRLPKKRKESTGSNKMIKGEIVSQALTDAGAKMAKHQKKVAGAEGKSRNVLRFVSRRLFGYEPLPYKTVPSDELDTYYKSRKFNRLRHKHRFRKDISSFPVGVSADSGSSTEKRKIPRNLHPTGDTYSKRGLNKLEHSKGFYQPRRSDYRDGPTGERKASIVENGKALDSLGNFVHSSQFHHNNHNKVISRHKTHILQSATREGEDGVTNKNKETAYSFTPADFYRQRYPGRKWDHPHVTEADLKLLKNIEMLIHLVLNDKERSGGIQKGEKFTKGGHDNSGALDLTSLLDSSKIKKQPNNVERKNTPRHAAHHIRMHERNSNHKQRSRRDIGSSFHEDENDFLEMWRDQRRDARKLMSSASNAKDKLEESEDKLYQLIEKGNILAKEVEKLQSEDKTNQVMKTANWKAAKKEFEKFQKFIEKQKTVVENKEFKALQEKIKRKVNTIGSVLTSQRNYLDGVFDGRMKSGGEMPFSVISNRQDQKILRGQLPDTYGVDATYPYSRDPDAGQSSLEKELEYMIRNREKLSAEPVQTDADLEEIDDKLKGIISRSSRSTNMDGKPPTKSISFAEEINVVAVGQDAPAESRSRREAIPSESTEVEKNEKDDDEKQEMATSQKSQDTTETKDDESELDNEKQRQSSKPTPEKENPTKADSDDQKTAPNSTKAKSQKTESETQPQESSSFSAKSESKKVKEKDKKGSEKDKNPSAKMNILEEDTRDEIADIDASSLASDLKSSMERKVHASKEVDANKKSKVKGWEQERIMFGTRGTDDAIMSEIHALREQLARVPTITTMEDIDEQVHAVNDDIHKRWSDQDLRIPNLGLTTDPYDSIISENMQNDRDMISRPQKSLLDRIEALKIRTLKIWGEKSKKLPASEPRRPEIAATEDERFTNNMERLGEKLVRNGFKKIRVSRLGENKNLDEPGDIYPPKDDLFSKVDVNLKHFSEPDDKKDKAKEDLFDLEESNKADQKNAELLEEMNRNLDKLKAKNQKELDRIKEANEKKHQHEEEMKEFLESKVKNMAYETTKQLQRDQEAMDDAVATKNKQMEDARNLMEEELNSLHRLDLKMFDLTSKVEKPER